MSHLALPFISVCLFFITTLSIAQQDDNDWLRIDDIRSIEKTSRLKSPTNFQLYELVDYDLVFERLAEAPQRFEESSTKQVAFELPLPSGVLSSYDVRYAPVMEESLARKFPDTRAYTLAGLDIPGSIAKIDFGPKGFHGMILIPGQSTVFIDPYRQEEGIYMVYYKKDYPAPEVPFKCLTETKIVEESNTHKRVFGDCQLRQYRLALACTGEYGQYHGGTVPLANAAMNTTLNRVNGVYESEAGITMILVANNDNLIYLNGATDPYTNNNAGTMLAENQTNCDAVIGSANYDIGHVFASVDGGVATLESPCDNSVKARGVTGQEMPEGDPFDIDYVCHEMGHQFGANHTQNNGCNRNSPTAMEPGSASTIMGYAGICAPNVQSNSDDYFHAVSLSEIASFVTNIGTGGSCAAILSSANNPPTCNAGLDYTVPISTPFSLSATGSDPDGNPITYCWEQYNNENSTQPPSPTSTVGPNFRSLDPTMSTIRDFPKGGIGSTWEVLPSVGRTMDFRLTVRDFDAAAGYGCTDEDDMQVTFHAGAGPFAVTAPNGGEFWTQGAMETVTWDVSNTDVTPVNSSQVSILLSTDGGITYPTVLATTTNNDGSHQITIPAVSTTTARIKVASADNIFFDVSNNDFSISVPVTCTTFVSTDVPVVIDPNSTGVYTSDLNIPITETIASIRVLDIVGTHTWVEDLIFTIIHPGATEAELINDECGNQDDFDMGFADGGAAISCPLDQGIIYNPVNPLSGFAGLSSNGIWMLEIEDTFAQDGGVLNGWSVEVCYTGSTGPCPEDDLVFDTTPIPTGTYSSNVSILASVSLENNADVVFKSNEINLAGGFLVPLGAELSATIGGCP